jgi:hypothetical protein
MGPKRLADVAMRDLRGLSFPVPPVIVNGGSPFIQRFGPDARHP